LQNVPGREPELEVVEDMSNTSPKKIRKWLETMPTLSELCAKFPEEWAVVQRDILAAYERSRSEAPLKSLSRPSAPALTQPDGAHRRRGAGKPPDPYLSNYIGKRMARLAIKNYGLIATSGVTQGIVRFNWLNGYIIKGLLFARELERKPVSLFWFRLMWSMVWQKNRLQAVSGGQWDLLLLFPAAC
jgi:hypothetical protein